MVALVPSSFCLGPSSSAWCYRLLPAIGLPNIGRGLAGIILATGRLRSWPTEPVLARARCTYWPFTRREKRSAKKACRIVVCVACFYRSLQMRRACTCITITQSLCLDGEAANKRGLRQSGGLFGFFLRIKVMNLRTKLTYT